MVPLESSKLFCDLPPADLAKVRKVTQERSFSHNQSIFQEGDPGDGIYVVKEGTITLAKVVAHGEARPPFAGGGGGSVWRNGGAGR